MWEQYDIDWTLHPDVNILAGINGSGKSTLLRILEFALSDDDEPALPNLHHLFHAIEISGEGIHIKMTGDAVVEWKNDYGFGIINTLDEAIHGNYVRALFKETPSPLSSYMNAIVFDTEARSLNNYRLKATENPVERHRIDHLQQWVATVNSFFATTQKTLVMEGHEVFFKQANGTSLGLDSLSSGEKKLLIILIKALVQDERPSILLMDEPEMSLDIDWQYRLVDAIRTINPACQLIIATHSPAIFGDGWNDKLFFMEDILKEDILKE
ncbi:MAG: ATP-binding protein [Prevotellaceae bacterium]|nr:ATP-binding protein [Prevotellaceae bacterium]